MWLRILLLKERWSRSDPLRDIRVRPRDSSRSATLIEIEAIAGRGVILPSSRPTTYVPEDLINQAQSVLQVKRLPVPIHLLVFFRILPIKMFIFMEFYPSYVTFSPPPPLFLDLSPHPYVYIFLSSIDIPWVRIGWSGCGIPFNSRISCTTPVLYLVGIRGRFYCTTKYFFKMLVVSR